MDLSRPLPLSLGVSIPMCNIVAKKEYFPRASLAAKISSPDLAILSLGQRIISAD